MASWFVDCATSDVAQVGCTYDKLPGLGKIYAAGWQRNKRLANVANAMIWPDAATFCGKTCQSGWPGNLSVGIALPHC